MNTSEKLQELIRHHAVMAENLREAANRARMLPGRGLHVAADDHERWGKLLTELANPTPEVPAKNANDAEPDPQCDACIWKWTNLGRERPAGSGHCFMFEHRVEGCSRKSSVKGQS